MKMKKPEELVEELEELGECQGPLTLGTFCTKCDAQFEINRESAAMAWVTGASFLDYVKYVQSSDCPNCTEKKQ